MENQNVNLIAVANELEAFILSVVPECSSLGKYGGTLYTLKPEEKEGQFCGVFIYAEHVQLSFSNGAKLQDPLNLLGGKGKFRRHVNYKSIDEIDYAYLEDLLKQSTKL